MSKVLVADNVSNEVFRIFDENNIPYDQKTGLSEDELCNEIKGYEGLVIRSAVTVTAKIINMMIKVLQIKIILIFFSTKNNFNLSINSIFFSLS